METEAGPAGDRIALVSANAEATRALGECLGRLVQGGDIVCLEGELGTGKTVFIQGLGRGMGIGAPVVSPSFTLVREYRARGGGLSLYHIDLYRLDSLEEMALLGWEDYLYGEGVVAIEWAEKARELLPQERLWVRLEYQGQGGRSLTFVARGERYRALLEEVRRECS